MAALLKLRELCCHGYNNKHRVKVNGNFLKPLGRTVSKVLGGEFSKEASDCCCCTDLSSVKR